MLAEQELSIKLVKKILSADKFYKTFFSSFSILKYGL